MPFAPFEAAATTTLPGTVTLASVSETLLGASATTAVTPASVATTFVRYTGAVGDGVTDDTATIAAELAAYDCLVLRPGKTYLVGQITVPAGKTLDGLGSAVLKTKANIGAIATVVLGTAARLVGVICDGNKTNQAVASVGAFVAASNPRSQVIDCTIHDVKGAGIGAGGSAWNYGRATGNWIYDCNKSGIVVNAAGSTAFDISGNKIGNIGLDGTDTAGISVYCGAAWGSSSLASITNNSVYGLVGAQASPIEVIAARYATIAGNTADSGLRGLTLKVMDSAITGNTISGQAAYAIEMNTLTRCAIVGNTIEGCASGMTGQGCTDLTIVGNRIADTTAAYADPHGIKISGADSKRLHIAGNSFLNVAGVGILLTAATEDVTIHNNTYAVAAGTTMAAGQDPELVVLYGATRASITDNVCAIGVAGVSTSAGVIKIGVAAGAGVTIARNQITATAGAPVNMCGIHAGNVATTGVRIERNQINGFAVGVRTSSQPATDVVVVDNIVLACTTKYLLDPTHIPRPTAAALRATQGADRVTAPAQWSKAWALYTPQTSTSIRTAGTGSAVTTAGTVSTPAPTTRGLVSRLTSAASVNSDALARGDAIVARGSSGNIAAGFSAHARIYLPDAAYANTGASTGTRLWGLALYATSAATLMGADRGGTQPLAGLGWANVNGGATDTNWQLVTCDGTTTHVTDTGLPMTPQHAVDLYLWCPAGGTTLSWQIDDLTAGTTATGVETNNLPGTTSWLSPLTGLRTIDAVARVHEFARLYVEADHG